MVTQQETDILSLIEADHQKVERLFEQIETAKSSAAYDCFSQIYKELSLHAHAEELVFYPAMRQYEQTAAYVEEAESEHNAAKILLEQMKALNPDDGEFRTKLGHLKETILHHVKEEEGNIFGVVLQFISQQERQQLGQEFQAAKARFESDVELALVS